MHSPDPNQEIKAQLRRSTLFQNLADAAIDRLAQVASVRPVPAATTIFERNSPGDEFYLVLEGVVELIIPTHPSVPNDPLRDTLMKNATDAVVDTREAGEFFGELACLVENGTRTATAHASRPCRLLVIPKSPFLEILHEVPAAAFTVLRQVADRLRWHTDHLARTVRRDSLVRPEDRDALEERNRTVWQAICDRAKQWSTSLWFALANVLLWAFWLSLNGGKLIEELPKIDGLTMWLSLQAILMSILILVSEMRAEQKAKLREATQFTNTHVAVEQTTLILHRLLQLEAELRHQRLKAGLRERQDRSLLSTPAP
jgi:CRP-like cAMP-binding protein